MPSCSHWTYTDWVFSCTMLSASYTPRTRDEMPSQRSAAPQAAGSVPAAHRPSAPRASSLALPIHTFESAWPTLKSSNWSVMLNGFSSEAMLAIWPRSVEPQSPRVIRCAWPSTFRRRILVSLESTPNRKRPLSNVNSPSIRPCLIWLSCRVDQMRMIWLPNCSGVKSGLTTPLVSASASAVVGYSVRHAIGRPLPNRYSWVQLLVLGSGAKPPKLNAVELPPVTGSFGRLLFLVLWASKVNEKRSLRYHF